MTNLRLTGIIRLEKMTIVKVILPLQIFTRDPFLFLYISLDKGECGKRSREAIVVLLN